MRPLTRVAGTSLLGGAEPPSVILVETVGVGDPSVLLPSEAAVVADAATGRRAEFAAGRWCARAALGRLGAAPTPLLPRADVPAWASRAPAWPRGIVGSITHTSRYAAAAVAQTDRVLSLGLDAEQNAPLPRGVLDLVSSPSERADLRRLAACDDRAAWDRLLFSAKEAAFKAWYPVTGRWLGFEHCRVHIDEAGTFRAELLGTELPLRSGTTRHLHGSWRTAVVDGEDLLATLICLPAG